MSPQLEPCSTLVQLYSGVVGIKELRSQQALAVLKEDV